MILEIIKTKSKSNEILIGEIVIESDIEINSSTTFYFSVYHYTFLEKAMKLNTETKKDSKEKYLYFFLVLLVVFSGWVVSLNPKKVTDVTVRLSLFAMEKGYQGVTRIDSGERVYTSIDYIKKIMSSPINLGELTLEPLGTIYIDLSFESETTLNEEINKAIEFGTAHEREKLSVPGSIRTKTNETLDITLNLKGNGLDHVLYKDKESLRVEVKGGTYAGMSEFTLQHPLVRDFQLEPIFMYITKQYGILSTELKLVNLIINGQNKGIFQIEEVGTKEHIERSGRLNSVVLRFKAPRNPQLVNSSISLSGRTVTYRTATFDSLESKQIKSNSELSEYEKIAKGRLREYLEGHLKASEVFDPVLMGRYIGIVETLGTYHPVIFHNFLFYYNPSTGYLEPIAHDGSLFQRYNHNNLVTNITDGFVEELLYDEKIFESYIETVYKFTSDLVSNEKFYGEIVKVESDWYKHLIKEFWLLEKVNFYEFQERALGLMAKSRDELSERSSRKKETLKGKKYTCSNSTTIKNDRSNEIKDVVNQYELIKSEFFKSDDCYVIKVWSTAFDYPKDGSFNENTFCFENRNNPTCNFKKIEIVGIEVIEENTNKIYEITDLVEIEYTTTYTGGFPKIPQYKTYNIQSTNIDSVRIYYKNLFDDKIVYVVSDEIIPNS